MEYEDFVIKFNNTHIEYLEIMILLKGYSRFPKGSNFLCSILYLFLYLNIFL